MEKIEIGHMHREYAFRKRKRESEMYEAQNDLVWLGGRVIASEKRIIPLNVEIKHDKIPKSCEESAAPRNETGGSASAEIKTITGVWR